MTAGQHTHAMLQEQFWRKVRTIGMTIACHRLGRAIIFCMDFCMFFVKCGFPLCIDRRDGNFL